VSETSDTVGLCRPRACIEPIFPALKLLEDLSNFRTWREVESSIRIREGLVHRQADIATYSRGSGHCSNAIKAGTSPTSQRPWHYFRISIPYMLLLSSASI
jgi:hypothetical protein